MSSLFVVLLTVFFILSPHRVVKAQTTTPSPSITTNPAVDAEKAALQDKIIEYQKKLEETQKQKNTLANQLEYLDTQTYITQLRIGDTENKMGVVEKETEIISGRIDSLDDKLDKQWRLFLATAYTSYKQRNASIFDLILNSRTANEMLASMKYHTLAQSNRQRLLVQTQETKLNFEEQKQLREKRKEQLTQLQATLDEQKQSLEQQQEAKKILISATQNRETIYQDLLTKAQQELAGFRAFAEYAGGGGLTSFGAGSNGWYYTQRDPGWGNVILPGSSSSLSLAGCAVTSVAMVCKSYGQDINPLTIASNSNNFIGGDLWNWAFSCNGRPSSGFVYMSKDTIKSNIKDKNARIVIRLISPSVSGLHFVVGWRWDDEKDDLIIHDPYYGPDIPFSTRYGWNQITSVVAIY